MEKVEISKAEYDRLKEDSEWLSCLYAAGVDSWEGIDQAREIYQEQNPDD